jgi:cellulose synthase/poly-beta-1,6-N-acetylglucosamine synthase-like glycosyltransferase
VSNPGLRKQQIPLGTSICVPELEPNPSWADTLRNSQPELSAASPLCRWQRAALGFLAAGLPLGIVLSPDATAMVVMALLTPAFFCVALLRAAAVADFASRRIDGQPDAAISAADLPIYSILVPLYREAHMAQSLVAALERLDWPVTHRDIIFITEASDSETRLALEVLVRGRIGMRILTVPPGAPQTKPRALMYALPHATGAFVVVYDAEDEPEPNQLQRAYRRFLTGGPELGCLQARLNIYNPRDSWITRQFTLEYTALFDALLPAVERLQLPIPLGGTSNHFRREVLEQSGGWDPYNVTEDADLGIRLARQGWRVAMLDSVTWEEAPETVASWLGQRTRWLKGWMQTSLVHLRRPAKLWEDLGPRGFLGFNVLMGGVILSALVHPLVYAYAIGKLWAGDLSLWPPEGWAAVIWWAGAANLVFAYVVGIVLVSLSAARRHGTGIALHAAFLPIYWIMISLAAYRALVDLALRPFHWRKTEHSGQHAHHVRRSTAAVR